ncbi:MAG: hypothetical protein R3F43_05165 [bacterium]
MGELPLAGLRGLRARFGADLEVESCAKLGARNDDFLRDGGQIPDCFPEGGSPKRTLVIFTMGGNDIAAWAGIARRLSAPWPWPTRPPPTWTPPWPGSRIRPASPRDPS